MKSPPSHRNPNSGSRSRSTSAILPPDASYCQPSSVKNRRTPFRSLLSSFFSSCFSSPPDPDASLTSDAWDSSRGRRRSTGGSSIYGSPQSSTPKREPGSMKFTIDEIYRATKAFSPSFKIGQGGYGTVYKGKLDDGTVVAVKRAKKSVHDKHLGAEFRSEVQTLAQIEHLNLVKFFGLLEHEDEKILVLEYVPNGTLREHLDYVCRQARNCS